MFRYILLSLLLTFQLSVAKGQHEADNWICGGHDTYIKFSTGNPVLYTPPPGICGLWEQAYCDFFFTGYCASSISDSQGNLKLYTNGEVVWNSNLDTIFDYGTNLEWNRHSSQSLLVPKPGNSSRYFFFNTPYLLTNEGVKYLEFDVTLNNGSGGLVAPSTTLMNPSCQKVTATYHANVRDIWVLVHEWNSNVFQAYLLTESGINSNSAISQIGTIHQEPIPPNPYGVDSGSGGEMKFSTSGNKVVLAIRGLDRVEVFDFNNETGLLTNPWSLEIESPNSIEFSHDGTLIYIGTDGHWSSLDTASVYQCDLLAGDSLAIVNSLVPVTASNISENWLQLGPDDNLYYVQTFNNDDLSAFTSPNSSGVSCGLYTSYLTIPGTYCGGNLRTLPNLFRPFLDRNILFSNKCLGDTCMLN
jgi:hypothetical protein